MILLDTVDLLEKILPASQSSNPINVKGTNYGIVIVDRLGCASVRGPAALGLSFVRLRSLGNRRDDISYRPDSITPGPNLETD